MLCQSYGGLNGRSISTPSAPRIRAPPCTLEVCGLTRSLLRPANFARAQASPPGVFRTGKKNDPPSIHPRRGAATRPTINAGSLVTPHRAVGKPYSVVTERKPFAPQEF